MWLYIVKVVDFLAKIFYKYIVTSLGKVFSYRSRKKFLETVWRPTLSGINKGLEDFFSQNALDETPEITHTFNNAEKSKNILGEKVHIFVPIKEIKYKGIGIDSKYNILSVLRTNRTKSIIKHMEYDLKIAVENIADSEILSDMDEEVVNLERKTKELKELERMIEDLHYDGKIKNIFQEIKSNYGIRKPNYRTKESVSAIFNNEYKKFLSSDGGVVQKISQNQLGYLNKGLKSWFIPYSKGRDPPKKFHDWRIFFANDTMKILSYARITDLKKGKFDDLIKTGNLKTQIPGLNKNESNKIIEDWVKGIGGVTKNKKIPQLTSPVEVILIKFEDYYHNSNEIVIDLSIKGNLVFVSLQSSRELFKKCSSLE